MRVNNIRALYTALSKGKTLALDSQGQIQTRSPVLSSLFSRTPSPPIEKDNLIIAMASMIENEYSSKGPQNLTQPMQLKGDSFEEVIRCGKRILDHAMIEQHVETWLEKNPVDVGSKDPKPITTGATQYIQRIWGKSQEENPEQGGDFSFPQLKAFIEKELNNLKEKNLFGTLACGFTLTSESLQSEMKYLQEGIREALSDTLKNHPGDFDTNNIYKLFYMDSKRCPPDIFGNYIKPDENTHGNTVIEDFYKDLLNSEVEDLSAKAVLSLLMTQTTMVRQAEMIMGMDTPFPLNPYMSVYEQNLLEFLTQVTGNPGGAPRIILTQTDTEFTLKQIFTVNITNVSTGDSFNAGNVHVLISVPKNQFPLSTLEPKVHVKDITVHRPNTFL